MKHRNWFWGIFFLAAAIFVIASQVGAFVSIGFWSIAATVLLAAVLISSVMSLNFFGIFFSLAFLYLIYQNPLHLVVFSFAMLMLVAFFASCGFSILFHNHWHSHWNRHGDWQNDGNWDQDVETLNGNDIFIKANFSNSCKYLHANCLKRARLTSSFGKLSVYFDQVRPDPAGAELNVNASFGEMILFLPKSWHVIDRAHVGFGAIDNDARETPAEPGSPTLTLTGSVSFAHLEIRRV